MISRKRIIGSDETAVARATTSLPRLRVGCSGTPFQQWFHQRETGCVVMKLDITGKRFGRLVAIRPLYLRRNQWMWEFQCDCGNLHQVIVACVTRGGSTSCGCYQRELAAEKHRSHGMTHTRTYASWCALLARCYNKRHHAYARYGGKGIKVCRRWRYSFENFLADMGERPNGLTLDRKDSSGNYSKKNCRWATWVEQERNRGFCIRIEHNGKSQLLVEWAEQLGFKQSTLRHRLYSGWTSDRIFSPVRGHK